MQTKIYFHSLILLITIIYGCAIERIPPSTLASKAQTDDMAFEPCLWQALPETRSSLLPTIRLIECELMGQLVPETIEFKFEMDDKLRGKQSNKIVETVELETGSNGAMYYLNYAPDGGVQESLGSWLGWLQESETQDVEGLLPNDDGEVHLESDGGIVYRAAWNIEKTPRGLTFILCGLGGLTPPCKMLGNELLEDGWAIVYIYTVLNAPEFGTKIELSNNNDYVSSAIKLLDLEYCQIAAATQAVQSRMENKFPSIKSLPTAIVGISAGALNTPAVYHEMKEDFDAVVLVAGGANMLDIIRNGAFTKWGFTHNDGIAFTNDELTNIGIEYLKKPSRDPYHLAPKLPHDNLLIVHAKFDAVVPAEDGDLLWQRAGQPERWIFWGGHLGLFMMFEKYAEDIADWLDSKID